ncbi:MAG: TonB-dependent receptor [Turneriella sp.]
MSRFVFLSLSVLLTLSAAAQKRNQGPATPGLNIEDELNLGKSKDAKKKKSARAAEDIADKDTTIEGEDEQYAPPRKSDIELPKISEGSLSRWEDEVRDLNQTERQGTKQVERKAQIRAEYGTQNALGAQIHITKKEDLGAYLIEYKRNKYDYEGIGKTVVANSALSHDALKLVGQLNFSQSYKMLLRTEYLETTRGLQANTTLESDNKKLGIFQWDNQIRPGDNQRITAGITGNLGRGTVSPAATASTRTADLAHIKAALEWQYIFGERNALTLMSDLWYGENTDYLTATPQYYRGGNAEARAVFPLARFILGAEQQALQIDATVGARVFFAQGFQPVVGPRLALDFFYPGYQGTFEFERSGRLPEIEKYFFTPLYQSPYRFYAAEDMWRMAAKNNFHITKETHLKAAVGVINYPVYFDRRLDSAQGLLELHPMSYRAMTFSASLAQNFGNDFYHDTGISSEYFIDSASLREPLSLFTRLHYTPGTWDFSLDLKYVHTRRESEAQTLITRDLAAYVLLGAGVEKAVLPSVKVFIRGENLFNQRYQLVSPYQTSGARGWFGLNMMF